MRLALTVAATLVSGCSFDASFDEGYRCLPDLPCPAGTTCVDSRCVAEAPAVDAAGDAIADAAAAHGCADAAVIAETFEADLDQAAWDLVIEGGASVEVEGGQLEVTPAGPSSNGGILGEDPVEITPGSVTVEVFDPDDTETSFQRLALMSSTSAMVVMERYRNTLRVTLADDLETLIEVAWNGVAHHRWRIQASGGELVFETAPAGGDWTELISGPAPDLGFLRVRLTAGNYEDETPEALAYDNLFVCREE